MIRSLIKLVCGAALVSALPSMAGCSMESADDGAPSDEAPTTNEAALTGKFVPANGKIQVFMGQTSDGIEDSLRSFDPRPAGVTMYTNPSLDGDGWRFPNGQIASQSADYEYNFGPQNWNYIKGNPSLANSALAVGFYLGYAYDTDVAKSENTMKMYLGGQFTGAEMRANIKSLITQLRDLKRPIFLRIGYEAEGYWNAHNPDAYKQVWQFVKSEIQAQNATNIATVWQLAAYCERMGNESPLVAHDWTADPYGSGVFKRKVTPNDYDVWYPGDNLVDWTAISLFTQNADCDTEGKKGYQVIQGVIDYLKNKRKPIMVTESSPKGYDLQAGVFQQVGNRKRYGLSGDQMWNEWFEPYFQLIEKNRDSIRAMAYINDDWTKYTHWQCQTDDNGNVQSGCAEGSWGKNGIQLNPVIKQRWQDRMNSGLYLFTAP